MDSIGIHQVSAQVDLDYNHALYLYYIHALIWGSSEYEAYYLVTFFFIFMM